MRIAAPPPPRVLGRTLQPATIWHVAALVALESPLVGEGTASIEDIQIASIILSQTPTLDRLPVMPKATWRDIWHRARYAKDSAFLRAQSELIASHLLPALKQGVWVKVDQARDGVHVATFTPEVRHGR